MYRISTRFLLPNSIAITLLVVGLTGAQALTTAGPKRPGTVPADYVITPFGYFHASCVTQLAEGDVVRQDENSIQHADGSFDTIHSCAYAHFTAAGEAIAPDAQTVEPPTISHAWIEYSSVTTSSSSYGELTANWIVPPAPSANNGQTVYLFPGMEDYKNVVTIIQPVLGWNADFASAWGIASWNCCKSGTVFESSPVSVKSGDVIFGTMKDTCAAGTLSCAKWNITTEDVTTGKSTTLANTSSQGQTFNWAFAGALEVYNIAACGDYPSNGSISFFNLALYNDSFVQIASPGWTVTNSSGGLTPQCSYGGSQPDQVDLTY
jgi:hypothetical protein